MDSGKVKSDYELYGHRQVGALDEDTECPGENLYRHIKTWNHWVSFCFWSHLFYLTTGNAIQNCILLLQHEGTPGGE